MFRAVMLMPIQKFQAAIEALVSEHDVEYEGF
jgi:hypothetical protein